LTGTRNERGRKEERTEITTERNREVKGDRKDRMGRMRGEG
jgi:hypothetical protein